MANLFHFIDNSYQPVISDKMQYVNDTQLNIPGIHNLDKIYDKIGYSHWNLENMTKNQSSRRFQHYLEAKEDILKMALGIRCEAREAICWVDRKETHEHQHELQVEGAFTAQQCGVPQVTLCTDTTQRDFST